MRCSGVNSVASRVRLATEICVRYFIIAAWKHQWNQWHAMHARLHRLHFVFLDINISSTVTERLEGSDERLQTAFQVQA